MAKQYPQLPENFNKTTVDFYIKACAQYFPIELGFKDHGFRDGPWGAWSGSLEFSQDLFDKTGEHTAIEAYDVLKHWETIAPETKTQLSSTVPSNINELAEAYDEAKTEEEKVRLNKLFLLEQQRKLEESKKITSNKKPSGPKMVFFEPVNETITKELTSQETEALAKFRESASLNPKVFIEKLVAEIIKDAPEQLKANVSPEELSTTSNLIALDFLSRIVSGKVSIPPEIFLSLLKTQDSAIKQLLASPETKDAVSFYTYLTSSSSDTTKTLLGRVVGENIFNNYYGNNTTEYKVTTEPTAKTQYALNLNTLQSDYSNFKNNPLFDLLKQKASEQIKLRLLSTGQNFVTKFVSELPSNGLGGLLKQAASSGAFNNALSFLSSSTVEYTATSQAGQLILSFAPDFAPIAEGLSGLFGIDFGITAGGSVLAPVAAGVAETGAVAAGGVGVEVAATATAAGVAAAEAGTAAAAVAAEGVAATAGTGLIATLVAATGPLAPIIGAIVAAIAPIIIPIIKKVLSWAQRKLKPFLEKFKVVLLGGAIAVAGAIVSVPIVAAGGVLIAAGGAAAVTAGVPIGVGVAGIVSGAISGIVNITIVSNAKYIALTLLGIIVSTALILFIINSGAYITPPATGIVQNLGQSPFITVTKEADINSFPNSSLPKTVNYTVTVSAPKGSLTNITFKDDCAAVKKDGNLDCPSPDPSLPSPPTQIDPSNQFSFTYKRSFDSGFTDSLITDSFTVSADSPDGNGTSIASATVIIGNPPTSCFNVVGDNWPANYKANVLAAIGTLTGSFPTYAAKLCHGTNVVKIVYDTSKNPGGWGYFNSGTIYLNGGGLSSAIDSLYIVAHESGHDMEFYGAPQLYTQYLDTTGVVGELPLCSYVNTTQPIEGFAETIALWVTHNSSSQWTRLCGGTFEAKYPNHYAFARDVIFK